MAAYFIATLKTRAIAVMPQDQLFVGDMGVKQLFFGGALVHERQGGYIYIRLKDD
ncbi:MAG: hypothetical protein RSA12_10455 [Clostridia bacterium]